MGCASPIGELEPATLLGAPEWTRMRELAREALEQLGLSRRPRQPLL